MIIICINVTYKKWNFKYKGLNTAALAFLTGTKSLTSIPKNSKELMESALKQEIMSYIEI